MEEKEIIITLMKLRNSIKANIEVITSSIKIADNTSNVFYALNDNLIKIGHKKSDELEKELNKTENAIEMLKGFLNIK